ncbi:MAG: aspartate kinase [Cytophagales bacterium]|nr:aspartate kinase [Cytophagales bacterium]
MKSDYTVFKFGGASVRNAAAIRQVARIVEPHKKERLVLIVSAMGKTTNALEKIVSLFLDGKEEYPLALHELRGYHEEVMRDLFQADHRIWAIVDREFNEIKSRMKHGSPKDQLYDQVVSRGEMVSSYIVAEFLATAGFPIAWIDATQYVRTDDTFREGKVNWDETEERILQLKPTLENQLILTQGFIGGNPDNQTTTLGREGSDFSAAIFGSCLNAASVTIWKDVPGVMNADPKRIKGAISFQELPFREAAEMAYYGASVIHPKTIKPLANRNIPLWVKSFDNPNLPGTIIHEAKVKRLPPLIVFKENQCLISCGVTDYSFINEMQLSTIFHALSELNLKINVMQNSAITFSFCVDFREDKVLLLIDKLAQQFEVLYNTGLTLITVKNYDEKTYEEYSNLPGIVLEQASRSTLQVLTQR